jgi:putative ubiquitin-RnfH superfamily antitoxin RatB of RatAB toxin-antitoxin module
VESLRIEVCCALPQRQLLVALAVPPGTTLMQAAERANVLAEFPGLDLAQFKFGVHGKLRDAQDAVQAGDRVELYRELTADPKIARRQRVVKARNARRK